jgi:L-alanine-DL-glutamate epimerase-like enolase superfamily enzyme
MKLVRFDVFTIEIPLRLSVEHSLATRKVARNVLVRASTADGGVGWGECCPREYVTGESIDSVLENLATHFLPPLLGLDITTLEDGVARLTELLDGVERDQQAAFCAAELAVLDLIGRATGVGAGEVLGPITSEQARYSGVIASEQLEGVKVQCTLMARFGLAEVKVKVGASLEANLATLEVARELLGDGVRLRLDANAAWDGAEAIRQLEAMSSFGIEGVEQPVPAADLAGMKTVTAAGLVPVVADESLCSLSDARTLIEEKGCDVFNVRISKCGGLINAGRIYELGQQAGLESQLGAQVGETGILSAAGRQFATRLQPKWCEGSYGNLLLEEDITEPAIAVGAGGLAPALSGPGLGVEPIEERVRAFESASFSIPEE